MATTTTVYFDRDCGFCTRSVAWVRPLDWLGLLRFVPLQSDEARHLGIEEHRTLSQMVVRKGDAQWGGWRAGKRVLVRLPLFWVGLAGIAIWQPVAGIGIAVALSPAGNPLGNTLYRWVARNRHRLPGSTCAIEIR